MMSVAFRATESRSMVRENMMEENACRKRLIADRTQRKGYRKAKDKIPLSICSLRTLHFQCLSG